MDLEVAEMVGRELTATSCPAPAAATATNSGGPAAAAHMAAGSPAAGGTAVVCSATGHFTAWHYYHRRSGASDPLDAALPDGTGAQRQSRGILNYI